MVYLFVFLVIVIRVFGFRKTLEIATSLVNSITTSKSSGEAVSEAVSKKLREFKAQPIFQLDGVEEVSQIEAMPENTVSAMSQEKRSAKKPTQRIIHGSGRSPEEILSGKPDFGWRRVY